MASLPLPQAGASLQARSRLAFVARKLVRLAVSAWILVTLAFLLVHLIPGDPVRASLGLTAPPELVEARRQALGLDRPLLDQYGDYLAGLARLDLGTSFMSQLPVSEIIGQRLANSLLLAGLAMLFVFLAGVAIGLTMAVTSWNGHRRADTAFDVASGFLTAMPEFVTAVILTSLFAVMLNWLPVAGISGPSSWILPVAALAIGPTAALARIIRIEALKVLAQDHMRTARAKRLGWRRLYLGHLLPNCLTAAFAIGGLLLRSLIAGTVLVENIFAWPGLGSALVLAILQKDYPLTQALILLFGLIILLVNLVVDLLIAAVDPRSTIAEA
jgi:peptide/nickel transport system permease protein